MTSRKSLVRLFGTVALVLAVSFFFAGIVAQRAEAEESILRFNSDWPNIIDPAIANDFSSMMHITNLYSPLVYPKPKGGVEPHLAESWEVSPDGLTWTFHLKPGVLFSDGTEVEAEDVKFSMDRTLTIGSGFSYLFSGWVTHTEAADKYTVNFHMAKPYGPFLATLIKFYVLNKDEVMKQIKPEGSYGDLGDYATEWLTLNSAGSGPYKTKEVIVTDYTLMEKNPHYSFYMAPKAPDLVKIIGNIEAATIQTMMRNRELEFSDFWQSTESFEVMDAIPQVEMVGFDVARAGYFEINTAKPPTDDLHFRRAMLWAFDFEAAISLFPGSKQPRGPVPHVLAGWNPDTLQYHRDLDKAKEELAQSKYKDQLNEIVVEYRLLDA